MLFRSNKSKGEYAYTMVDVGSPVEGRVIDDIRALPGMIRIRAI